MAPAKVAILDAGSQFGKLIDRRLHEIGIECDLVALNTDPEILNQKYGAVVISGSPGSVNEKNAPSLAPDFFQKFERPVLGICYGLQLINKLFGGKVEAKGNREDGQFFISINNSSKIFQDISPDQELECLLTHGDQVTELANDLECIGQAGDVIVAVQHKTRPIYALQFHPEVDLTPRGKEIFNTFIKKIAELKCDFTVENREESCIREIREKVGKNKLVILVSGGVDSSVLTVLCRKALGEEACKKQLYALHIDNGFMRHEESDKVEIALKKLGVELKVLRASDTFLASTTKVKVAMSGDKGDKALVETEPLYHTVDPEHKRKIIGDTFMRVTQQEIEINDIDFDQCFIAQGTLRPDLIESASSMASGSADTIKTHHNDTELVRELRKTGRVVEPLRDFHKDEVRELGRRLGLPEEFIERHPFPGPGLAIRIICHQDGTASADKLKEIIQKSDEVNTPSMIKTFVRYSNAQANPNLVFTQLRDKLNPRDQKTLLEVTERFPGFSAVLMPFRTVGVQGDGRTYSLCAAISYENSTKSDLIKNEQFWKALYQMAKIMPTVLTYVNRVVFMFGDNAINETPNFTTDTTLTLQSINQLRQADHICTQSLLKHDCYKKISQMPVVSLPVDFNANDQSQYGYGKQNSAVLRSICIRPFITNDFMTGVPALPVKDIPLECFMEMVDRIQKEVIMVSRVMIDLTPKPPGTTEWE
jgi:GMP synthase (glutamine-hydrolysing)